MQVLACSDDLVGVASSKLVKIVNFLNYSFSIYWLEVYNKVIFSYTISMNSNFIQ